jgi:RHS repeat-associated protein
MAGISDQAIKTQYAVNKYRFNDGTELANKEFSDGSGLEIYETDARGYDPQIGRFWEIDPLADLNENSSPYSFANDNPIFLNDPLGMLSDSLHPQTLPTAVFT